MRPLHAPLQRAWHRLRDECDWALGAHCSGCGSAGISLCRRCAHALTVPHGTERRAMYRLHIVVAIAPSVRVHRVLSEFKRRGSQRLARQLGRALRALVLTDPAALTADALVIPPSRVAALRTRGFVPLERVARSAGLRVLSPCTVRADVRDQRGLSAHARQRNVQHAFTVREHDRTHLAGTRVILLDDIVTTGATLDALRTAVQSAGAEVVSVWALTATLLGNRTSVR